MCESGGIYVCPYTEVDKLPLTARCGSKERQMFHRAIILVKMAPTVNNISIIIGVKCKFQLL